MNDSGSVATGLIDLAMIRAALFDAPTVRANIIGDYRLAPTTDAKDIEAVLLAKLDQPELAVESTRHDNRIVFRAAARAIGSNNRRWVDFQKVERKLAEETGGFDPTYTAKRGDEGTAAMKALLKGLTSTRDSDAIMNWALRLDVPDSFNACLLDWRRLIASSAAQRGVTLSHPELTAVIALALGAPGALLQ